MAKQVGKEIKITFGGVEINPKQVGSLAIDNLTDADDAEAVMRLNGQEWMGTISFEPVEFDAYTLAALGIYVPPEIGRDM